jgi:hypothetical protein
MKIYCILSNYQANLSCSAFYNENKAIKEFRELVLTDIKDCTNYENEFDINSSFISKTEDVFYFADSSYTHIDSEPYDIVLEAIEVNTEDVI